MLVNVVLSFLYCMYTHTHMDSNCTVSFIMYLRFHHPPPSSSKCTHRHTHTSKYPLPRIPSSKLHSNHSLTPITMATGISFTHTFFLTDQFPLCLMCLSLYTPLSQPPPPFSKKHHFPLTCVLLFLERKSAPTQQPADTIFVRDRLVCYSGGLVAVVQPVVHLQCPLPEAKCP